MVGEEKTLLFIKSMFVLRRQRSRNSSEKTMSTSQRNKITSPFFQFWTPTCNPRPREKFSYTLFLLKRINLLSQNKQDFGEILATEWRVNIDLILWRRKDLMQHLNL
jgi:hypothetical protein